MSNFAELRKIDVSKHVEKKNGLSYLSWAWAVDQLLQRDPTASWSYGEPKIYADTMMLFCTVKAFNVERTAQLPVMDHRNQPIKNPNAFQVNTAMQRCLAKAIALHGIGLYIYAGEDLPEADTTEPEVPTPKESGKSVAQSAMDALPPEDQNRIADFAAITVEYLDAADDRGAVDYIERLGLSADEKAALWSLLDSKQRGRIKKAAKPELVTA